MNKKVAILRGINVGGKRKILMTDLKLLFKNLGFSDIETYIQSGNVIFDSETKLMNAELASQIEELILDKYKFKVPVIVRTAHELKHSIQKNPFYNTDDKDISHLHLTFLKEKPTTENRLKAESYNYEPDKFEIVENDVFISCNGKYHQSKLTNNFFETKLKVSATTRNWKTVLRLQELSK